MKLWLCVISALILAAGTSPAGGAGTTGALLMKETFGARPKALGEAYCSIANDPYSLNFNVAGLSRVDRKTVATHYTPGFIDSRQFYLGYAQPIGLRWGAGASLAVQDAGKIEIVDEYGATETRQAARDWLLSAGFAYATPRMYPWGKVNLGFGLKYFRSVLVEEMKGKARAFDFGLLWETIHRIRLGFSISNFGSKFAYKGGLSTGEKDPLPLTIRAGVSRDIAWSDASHNLLTTLEAAKTRDEPVRLSLGAEYSLFRIAAFRFGYIFSKAEPVTLSVGAGILFKGIRLDYCFGKSNSPIGDNLQHVSISMGFGPSRREAVRTARKVLDLLRDKMIEDYSARRYFWAAEKARKIMKKFLQDKKSLWALKNIKRWAQSVEKMKEPPEFELNYARGYVNFYLLNDYTRAVGNLEKALRLNPGSKEVAEFLERAKGFSAKQKEEEARKAKIGIELRMKRLWQDAKEAYERKDYEISLKKCRELLRFSPGHEEAFGLLEASIQALGARQSEKKPDPMIRGRIKRVRKTSPERIKKAERICNRAVEEYVRGNLKKAEGLLEESLRIYPGYSRAIMNLKRVRKELKGLP